MYKILLADDVRLSLAAEKSYLEGRNMKVFATTSAVEARELAGIVQPDLVVLDYEMPEFTGAEICAQLKEDPQTSHIPILIVTAHTDNQNLTKQCREAGAAGLLRKSDGREALLEEVARILGVPRRRRVRVPCRFTVGIAQGGQAFSGHVENISNNGMFLIGQRSFAAGLALRLSFDLPGIEGSIRLLGEVIREEELSDSSYGFGIQFLEMDRESRDRLSEFLENSL